jgi:hypothetical protein
MERMSILDVREDDLGHIQFLLFLLTLFRAMLSKDLERNGEQKNAENRYSKGFYAPMYHTHPEIWRKDKGEGVKNGI